MIYSFSSVSKSLYNICNGMISNLTMVFNFLLLAVSEKAISIKLCRSLIGLNSKFTGHDNIFRNV